MPTVDQMLRAWAKTRRNLPFWVVQKDCLDIYPASGHNDSGHIG